MIDCLDLKLEFATSKDRLIIKLKESSALFQSVFSSNVSELADLGLQPYG